MAPLGCTCLSPWRVGQAATLSSTGIASWHPCRPRWGHLDPGIPNVQYGTGAYENPQKTGQKFGPQQKQIFKAKKNDGYQQTDLNIGFRDLAEKFRAKSTPPLALGNVFFIYMWFVFMVGVGKYSKESRRCSDSWLLNRGTFDFFLGMGRARQQKGLQALNVQVYSPENERMSPENQWLEDVFPTEIVPF